MVKELSLAVKVCNFITKYSIFALIFLMPLFFLPWTAEVLDFNKQTILIGLVSISLFSWMLKVLISGEFEINITKTHIFVGIFFLAGLLSTIFSSFTYGSFWGWPQITAESLLSLAGFIIFYFLVSNTFSKKDIFISSAVFSASALLAELIGVLQILGIFIIPFDFAKSFAFNTIGSAGSLGIFAAVLLPLAIVLLILAKKWWKILFILQIVFSAMLLLLINYNMVWWVIIASSAVLIIFGIIKRSLIDGRWLALPMFFWQYLYFLLF